ncbi:MAG: DUF2029 domain-containing protein [Chloroflexi bacterium]|nr:MAG: DUF2029 domain-containing protein [Chloroflexota bacterium]
MAWATALAATGVGVSLIWLGWPAWQAFFETLPRKIAETPELSVTAYQNNGGFWQHLLHYDAKWNPGPLVDAPILAWLLAAVVGLGALAVTWLLARSTTLALALAASTTLSVLLFPSAEEYHYVLMQPVVARSTAAERLGPSRGRADRLAAAVQAACAERGLAVAVGLPARLWRLAGVGAARRTHARDESAVKRAAFHAPVLAGEGIILLPLCLRRVRMTRTSERCATN